VNSSFSRALEFSYRSVRISFWTYQRVYNPAMTHRGCHLWWGCTRWMTTKWARTLRTASPGARLGSASISRAPLCHTGTVSGPVDGSVLLQALVLIYPRKRRWIRYSSPSDHYLETIRASGSSPCAARIDRIYVKEFRIYISYIC